MRTRGLHVMDSLSSTRSYLSKTLQINLILDRDKYGNMRYNSLAVEEETDERREPGDLSRLMYSGFKQNVHNCWNRDPFRVAMLLQVCESPNTLYGLDVGVFALQLEPQLR